MINNSEKLAKDVMEFLFQCEVLNNPITSEEEGRITRGLTEPVFVEELIGILMNYVKCSKNINYKEVKALYITLNDLRFDLEYKGMNER